MSEDGQTDEEKKVVLAIRECYSTMTEELTSHEIIMLVHTALVNRSLGRMDYD